MRTIICLNKIILISLIFFSTTSHALLYGADYKNFNDKLDFTDEKVVLIQKGDDPSYKNPGLDDSAWHIVSLPSSWEDLFPGWSGICWYRLHIKFPPDTPKKSIGINLGTISDVDEVYFNGHLIGQSGKFPPARVSSYDKQRIYEITAFLINPGKDNVIAIRVACLFQGECGPVKGKFYIASFQKIQADFFLNEFIDLLLVAIYLSIAVYFSLVFLKKSGSMEYLFFTLFILTTCSYLFFRSQIKYFLSDDFIFLKKSEYITLIILLPLMMEYITFFFREKHTLFHYIYFFITAVSMGSVLYYNDPVYWNKILIYLIEPAWVIPVLICLYISLKKLGKESNAGYIFASFIIVWILFINDVLVERMIYDFPYLSKYGFIIIITGTAIIMRKRILRLSGDAEIYRIRKARKPSVTEETMRKFEKAVAFLNENYTSDIARENFAESIGINHDYLGKLFIQLKGMKMNDYINELRIKKAAEMLKGSDKSVTEIAFSVGFESLSTFFRVFQKNINESPNTYREKNKALK